MEVPVIKGLGSNFRVEWLRSGVAIDFGHIREHSESVSAEVMVHGKDGMDKLQPIKFTTLNLKADRSRQQLAASLDSRYEGKQHGIDWDMLLEQACWKVIQEIRRGEPEVKMIVATGEPVAPLDWLIKPMVMRGEPTMIFSREGKAKSWIASTLALMAYLPWKDNGLGLAAPDSSSPVLYLDWESREPSFRRRFTKFAYGNGLEAAPIIYRHCSRPLIDDLDAVENMVRRHGIQMMVVDSVGMATGADYEMNDKRAASTLANACRQIDVSSVWITHEKKNKDERGNSERTAFGSVYFHAEARMVFQVSTEENDVPLDGKVVKAVDAGFTCTKFNDGPKPPPFAWRFWFNDKKETVRVTKGSIDDIEGIQQSRRAEDRIYSLIKRDGPMSVKEIAEELGEKANTISQTLKRAKTHKGQFWKGEDDNWYLVDKIHENDDENDLEK